MFYVSEPVGTAPAMFKTPLQQRVYETLAQHQVPFQRVDCDEAITMEDCMLIDERLQMKTVKTLFLCNRQQTQFYLLVTTAGKPFVTKDLGSALGIPRVSFAPVELLRSMMGTEVGATTILSVLLDTAQPVRVVLDRDVLQEEWYGCADGTTTSYMKLPMAWVMEELLAQAGKVPTVIDL